MTNAIEYMRKLVHASGRIRSNEPVVGPPRTKKPLSPEGAVFGATVERLRKATHLTQEQLAGAAGLTTNYVSDIERGKKVPSLTTILRLADGLSVAPADLLADFRAQSSAPTAPSTSRASRVTANPKRR